MSIEQRARLHHGGNDVDNPILEGQILTIKLHKKDDTHTLRKAYVLVGGAIFFDLTSLAVETREYVTIDIEAGVHLSASFPAKKNVIVFTIGPGSSSKQILWVATKPAAMITLDGYNADDVTKPLIYPLYKIGHV